MILQKNENNQIFESAQLQENCIELTKLEAQAYLLQRTKDAKIAQLKINFDNASKKPFALNQVNQIDKDGKIIGKVNAFFNIQDASSLTDSANIVFAGSIMKTQAFLKLLCVAIGKDFDAIKNQVNALSDNPTTASIANIPYTTKDIDGKEIRVLLSFKEIFA